MTHFQRSLYTQSSKSWSIGGSSSDCITVNLVVMFRLKDEDVLDHNLRRSVSSSWRLGKMLSTKYVNAGLGHACWSRGFTSSGYRSRTILQ